MKLKSWQPFLWGWLLFVWFATSIALTLPSKPDNYVNDYAKILTSAQTLQLNSRLKTFQDKTTTQIVVAIFPSLEGDPLEDVSIALADRWKIGSKKNDNGVILSVFIKDRKMRIEVGYGLEGALTDAISSDIIRNKITPYFKQGNYYQGLSAGVNAIMAATQHEYKATPQTRAKSQAISKWFPLFFFLMIVVTYLFSFFGPRRNPHIQGQRSSMNRRGDGPGGFFGGFGGGNGGGFGGGGGGGFGGGGASGGW